MSMLGDTLQLLFSTRTWDVWWQCHNAPGGKLGLILCLVYRVRKCIFLVLLYTLCFSGNSSLCLRKCIFYNKNSEAVRDCYDCKKMRCIWNNTVVPRGEVHHTFDVQIYSAYNQIQSYRRDVLGSQPWQCLCHAEGFWRGFLLTGQNCPARSQMQLWAAAFAPSLGQRVTASAAFSKSICLGGFCYFSSIWLIFERK